MAEDNPFKRHPPAAQGDHDTIKQQGDTVCPFFGNSIIPQVKQSPIAQAGGSPEIGMTAQFWPCQEERCEMWSKEAGGCMVKQGLESMTRLETLLAPLANHPLFGGKGG